MGHPLRATKLDVNKCKEDIVPVNCECKEIIPIKTG